MARPGPEVQWGRASVVLVAASLACWTVQVLATLGGALRLRGCADECHGGISGPLALTIFLAPAGIGLLVGGLAAWNRAGHEVPAPRLLRGALAAGVAGLLVVAGVSVALAGPDRGSGYQPYEIFAFVNVAALAGTALALRRKLRCNVDPAPAVPPGVDRPRSSAMVLAMVDAVLVVAGVLVAISRAGADRAAFLTAGTDEPGSPAATAPPASRLAPPPPVTRADVADRPAPERAVARGRWAATVEGRAERLRIYAPAVAVDGVRHTDVSVTAVDPRPRTASDGWVTYLPATALALPDGSRWYPLEPYRLDGTGDVPLNSPITYGGRITGTTSFSGLVGKGVDATGRFVTRDGREVGALRLPAGTRLSRECAGATPAEVPEPCGAAEGSVEVTVGAPGMTVAIDDSRLPDYDGTGDGAVEVEMAGTVRARALGREWTGLVGSLEADDVRGTAVWDGVAWNVKVTARSARQVWIDVWPVVGTTLEVTSGYDDGPHGCSDDCSVRLRYRNVGYATAQILTAEAVGGTRAVALDLNATKTHDAGLGVHRGGEEINLRDGRGIDSHLPPGDYNDRGLTHTVGVPVTLELRGNFDDVRVPLAIPASRL